VIRDVSIDLAKALKRGKSTLSYIEATRLLSTGKLWIGKHMSGGGILRYGRAEILFVGGDWDGAEARWMYDEFGAWADAKGVTWAWRGRPSWVRFLRMKGFRT
jgi:hypothetical protein